MLRPPGSYPPSSVALTPRNLRHLSAPWRPASLIVYFASISRLFTSEAAMERVRISRQRSKPRVDEAVDDMPTQPVVTTDEAAELITRIDQLLDE